MCRLRGQLGNPVRQLKQILRAERGTTRGGLHERIRRHRISPPSRQRKQLAVHAIDVDRVVTVVPATLDELQLATEQRMEPMRRPNRDGYGASSASCAFDDGVQQRLRARHPDGQAEAKSIRLIDPGRYQPQLESALTTGEVLLSCLDVPGPRAKRDQEEGGRVSGDTATKCWEDPGGIGWRGRNGCGSRPEKWS